MKQEKKIFPFDRMAVVVGFSPNTKKLILEAKRLCEIYDAKLYAFHIGKDDLETEVYFRKLFQELKISKVDINFQIKESINIESTIAKSCNENEIDLLIMGALKEESFVKKYITGSISRNVIKKVKCSVLLLVEPLENRQKFDEVVVLAEKGNPKIDTLINTSLYLAKKEVINRLNFFLNIPNDELELSISSLELTDSEKQKLKNERINRHKNSLENFLKSLKCKKDYKIHISLENKFLDLTRLLRDIHSDLLLINSNNKRKLLIDTLFPKDMDQILDDLPCNLLIVHI